MEVNIDNKSISLSDTYSIIILRVVMLSVIMLSVIIISVAILNVWRLTCLCNKTFHLPLSRQDKIS